MDWHSKSFMEGTIKDVDTDSEEKSRRSCLWTQTGALIPRSISELHFHTALTPTTQLT